ncbi:olfactory receptor class A-like protein 1 [Ambystoma mexicanum]|uniref:olfactory receptor class A-like protein 1 n=1 Tax=Ambystoma mexicanum TaxID=8296 RepID=UPI0037E92EDA
MLSYSIIKGTIYFLISTVGVVGNTLIMMSFALIAHQEHQLAKSETILSHLAAANLIVYLTRTLPAVFYEYGWRRLFDDGSCKVVVYVFRIFRGMAIGLTCLLSCFQCGILSRTNMADKQKINRSVYPLIAVLYLANMAMNAHSAMLTTAPYNVSNFKYTFNLGFCLLVYPEKISFEAKGYASFAFDLLFVILMALASVFILLILHRHSKKMKAVRNEDQNQGTRAETQASKTVILLVCFYVSFYSIDNIIWLSQTILNELNVVVSDIRVFFTMCYGAIFPVILSVFNKKIKKIMLKSFNKKQEVNDEKETTTQRDS